ncbi:glutathione peroxidase [Balneicella halophila]|uniref:Glutathione peroxidase n=1 Tax=Balneicella halophila TaxID=1537566 RepID=A0A7L4UN49_BALHA|nr:glutathione peroxidase [Balneicella halophila]PVX49213.1 glutathione peroxidase [Balneicella halophila]
MDKTDFYNLNLKTPKGDTIRMDSFKNKVVLIVNTATKCGFAPQFKGLEELHQKYKDKGLVILGFPCNQFQNQEPETNDSIEEACEINFGVSFQLTEKVDVNGINTHPVFRYLKKELGGLFGKRIKWNFTKFLISKDGTPYKRYSSFTKPSVIEKDIIKILN